MHAAEPNAAAVGVILAGGPSRRFGAPKGLARIAGERIIDRVARALRGAADELLLVANAPGADGWLPGVPCIRDRIPGGGGLSGVHAALEHTGRPVLVVAWDMPFVTSALLCALRDRCRERDADACLPESDAPVGMEPFCACYAPSCLSRLADALRAGRVGGAQFARTLPHAVRLSRAEVRAVGDPERMLLSVNTPADQRRAEAIVAESM